MHSLENFHMPNFTSSPRYDTITTLTQCYHKCFYYLKIWFYVDFKYTSIMTRRRCYHPFPGLPTS